jgi:hypothetical protein
VVVDMCCGHGFTGLLFAVFEKSCEKVLLCDHRPQSENNLAIMKAVCEVCDWVKDKVVYHQLSMEELAPLDNPHAIIPKNASLVAIHACGPATDDCLDLAMRLRLPIAVMPCCYRKLPQTSPPVFMEVFGRGASIDVDRTYRLHMANFAVVWSAIPICITGSHILSLHMFTFFVTSSCYLPTF